MYYQFSIKKVQRISKYLIDHDKEYIATLKLGTRTDTGDITRKSYRRKRAVPTKALEEEKHKRHISLFYGWQAQIPPMYSAIKVDGKNYMNMQDKVKSWSKT